MRVIAGLQKGRRLVGPRGAGLRPTSARVKEALFAILGPAVAGARFLDLYAGTGAIGIEALSRGARWATFVEPNRSSLRVLRHNLNRCGLTRSADVHACSAGAFLRRTAEEANGYDIVFADPPYQAEGRIKLLTSLVQSSILRDGATMIFEHLTKLPVPQRVGPLIRLRQYSYGDTTLSVFGLHSRGTSSL